jgi:hypothetical protein
LIFPCLIATSNSSTTSLDNDKNYVDSVSLQLEHQHQTLPSRHDPNTSGIFAPEIISQQHNSQPSASSSSLSLFAMGPSGLSPFHDNNRHDDNDMMNYYDDVKYYSYLGQLRYGLPSPLSLSRPDKMEDTNGIVSHVKFLNA